MIIISSRKFRDSQQEYFRKALTEDVILTTVHHGCFKLVPIIEGEPRGEEGSAEPPAKKESMSVSDKREKQIIHPQIEETPVMKEEEPAHLSAETESEEQGSEIIQLESKESKEKPAEIQETEKKEVEKTSEVKTVSDSSNVYVDPALYDAYPEIYAKELAEERKMIEDLQAKGLKKLFRRKR